MRSCCQRSPRWRANAARYSCRAANAAAAWEDRRRGESVAVLGAASAPVDLCGHVLEALFAEHHECQHLRSRKQARRVARQPSRQTRKGAGRQPVSAPGAALHPVQRARARARTHNRAHAGTDTQGRHCAERDPTRSGQGWDSQTDLLVVGHPVGHARSTNSALRLLLRTQPMPRLRQPLPLLHPSPSVAFT